MKLYKKLPLVFLITLAPIVSAQETRAMPGFLNAQLSEQLKNQTLALSDPALVKAQALLFRQHYEALIEVGFSKDEALKIVVAIASDEKD